MDDSGYSETCVDEDDDVADIMGMSPELSEKLNRYVAFNMDIFEYLLKGIVANRSRSQVEFADTPLQEVSDMISLPQFDEGNIVAGPVPDLDPKVRAQLGDYISVIARTYRPNPFHNFEHASHVLVRVLRGRTPSDHYCHADNFSFRLLRWPQKSYSYESSTPRASRHRKLTQQPTALHRTPSFSWQFSLLL